MESRAVRIATAPLGLLEDQVASVAHTERDDEIRIISMRFSVADSSWLRRPPNADSHGAK
ncbi:MAG: BrnT family toxin [Steroidobacteraceae bacterium]